MSLSGKKELCGAKERERQYSTEELWRSRPDYEAEADLIRQKRKNEKHLKLRVNRQRSKQNQTIRPHLRRHKVFGASRISADHRSSASHGFDQHQPKRLIVRRKHAHIRDVVDLRKFRVGCAHAKDALSRDHCKSSLAVSKFRTLNHLESIGNSKYQLGIETYQLGIQIAQQTNESSAVA